MIDSLPILMRTREFCSAELQLLCDRLASGFETLCVNRNSSKQERCKYLWRTQVCNMRGTATSRSDDARLSRIVVETFVLMVINYTRYMCIWVACLVQGKKTIVIDKNKFIGGASLPLYLDWGLKILVCFGCGITPSVVIEPCACFDAPQCVNEQSKFFHKTRRIP